MFFIDQPYVSDFFKKTVRDFNIPIVETEVTHQFDLYEGTELIKQNDAVNKLRSFDDLCLYTTSENAIGWISKHLAFTELPSKIELFKDKFKFRELTKSIFPDFYYKKCSLEELSKLEFNEIPHPFIIKPAVGFFSMGVYKVSNDQQWQETIHAIHTEMNCVKNLYPEEVLDTRYFIIEQIIDGEEFAIDAYYDSTGEAVILGIFKHIFSSDSDVSDRVYMTSKEIIENNLQEFTDFIQQFGQLSGVKNFPVHIELRRDINGTLLPIEVNPMRFGGWCTTADVTYLAYDFNPYQYYFSGLKPDWSEALKEKEGLLFSIIVLDNSSGIMEVDIQSFNYKKLWSKFEKPLELRKINYKKYPVFGFLFTETSEDNFNEITQILNSNLKEYITVGN